jgi:hypothetical protein
VIIQQSHNPIPPYPAVVVWFLLTTTTSSKTRQANKQYNVEYFWMLAASIYHTHSDVAGWMANGFQIY